MFKKLFRKNEKATNVEDIERKKEENLLFYYYISILKSFSNKY